MEGLEFLIELISLVISAPFVWMGKKFYDIIRYLTGMDVPEQLTWEDIE